MQTIDSYVVYSSPNARRRRRRRRALLAAVPTLFAIAIAAGIVFMGRADDPAAARSKLDARVVAESSTASRSDDEARIAAFQESVAISHLAPAASAAGADQPQTAEPGARPTSGPPRKPAQRPTPKSAGVATPVPQSRPATPEVIPDVIVADLPPAPRVAPAPPDAKPQFLGTIAQDVERAPGAVQDFARRMTDGVLGGLADVRVRVGL
jgi:hypothetical protein